MSLGTRLIEAGLVTQDQVNQALEQQRRIGGTLGENMVRLHAISPEDLNKFLTPAVPTMKASDSGISAGVLLMLMIKTMYLHSLRTVAEVAKELKLPPDLVKTIMMKACERQLVDPLGKIDSRRPDEIYYALSGRGLTAATEALDKCSYVGPAPVSLEAFSSMVRSQRITDDRADEKSLHDCLSHLALDENIFGTLGPIVNSGQEVLLYGSSGDGKTALAISLHNAFRHTVYVPYAVEVDGQIIRVYDPEIHTAIQKPVDDAKAKTASVINTRVPDERWIACKRPLAICGGETDSSMMELSFNPITKIYEAPIQMKAAGGIILIDDLGRQKSHLSEAMNRWLVQMERGVSYLLLNTGKKFGVPFNGLVILTTNMKPEEVIDPAILRRIPYKIFMASPSKERYIKIFQKVCQHNGVEYNSEAVETFIRSFYIAQNRPMVSFHPDLLLRNIMLRNRYEQRATEITYDNLVIASEQMELASAQVFGRALSDKQADDSSLV